MKEPGLLFSILVLLILASAFFSGSETSMMSINRYRLRHLVRKKHKASMRVSQLLTRVDRLLGVILIGNTFANIMASAIATVIAVHFFGEIGVFITTLALTFVILIFSEILPKTLAALYPERLAFFSSLPLKWVLGLIYPVVWVANVLVSGLLRLFNIKIKSAVIDHLSHEELRTVLHEATGKIPAGYQNMMLGVLDLGNVTVDDIVVPRNEIVGLDINGDWEEILQLLTNSQHTRLPVYRDHIDDVIGMLHTRRALNLLAQNRLDKKTLLEATEEVHFVPEGTPLDVQLVNFRREKLRIGLVVDEYGVIQGLVTLEDILEEIVGEFTTDLSGDAVRNIQRQEDGSYLVAGVMNVRDLNRLRKWDLPTDGPKTLSGLIVEHLESIPESGVCLRLGGYPIEVLKVKRNTVRLARIWPKLRKKLVERETEEKE